MKEQVSDIFAGTNMLTALAGKLLGAIFATIYYNKGDICQRSMDSFLWLGLHETKDTAGLSLVTGMWREWFPLDLAWASEAAN